MGKWKEKQLTLTVKDFLAMSFPGEQTRLRGVADQDSESPGKQQPPVAPRAMRDERQARTGSLLNPAAAPFRFRQEFDPATSDPWGMVHLGLADSAPRKDNSQTQNYCLQRESRPADLQDVATFSTRFISHLQTQTQTQSSPTNPSFHAPAPTKSKAWLSDAQKLRHRFDKMKTNASHLGFANSPFFPQSGGDYATILAEQRKKEAANLTKTAEDRALGMQHSKQPKHAMIPRLEEGGRWVMSPIALQNSNGKEKYAIGFPLPSVPRATGSAIDLTEVLRNDPALFTTPEKTLGSEPTCRLSEALYKYYNKTSKPTTQASKSKQKVGISETTDNLSGVYTPGKKALTRYLVNNGASITNSGNNITPTRSIAAGERSSLKNIFAASSYEHLPSDSSFKIDSAGAKHNSLGSSSTPPPKTPFADPDDQFLPSNSPVKFAPIGSERTSPGSSKKSSSISPNSWICQQSESPLTPFSRRNISDLSPYSQVTDNDCGTGIQHDTAKDGHNFTPVPRTKRSSANVEILEAIAASAAKRHHRKESILAMMPATSHQASIDGFSPVLALSSCFNSNWSTPGAVPHEEQVEWPTVADFTVEGDTRVKSSAAACRGLPVPRRNIVDLGAVGLQAAVGYTEKERSAMASSGASPSACTIPWVHRYRAGNRWILHQGIRGAERMYSGAACELTIEDVPASTQELLAEIAAEP